MYVCAHSCVCVLEKKRERKERENRVVLSALSIKRNIETINKDSTIMCVGAYRRVNEGNGIGNRERPHLDNITDISESYY